MDDIVRDQGDHGVHLDVAEAHSIDCVQILMWPLGFLSNVFAAPATMPAVLSAITEWNPLSATAAAARELFGNPGWGGDSWVANNGVLMAIVWPVLLIAVFFPLAVRQYHRLRS